jgi:hypothetical protein
MALRGHPRYGEAIRVIRHYDSIKGDYCVAEYEREPGKRYYLPAKWLSRLPVAAAPKPANNTIAFSTRALSKMVDLIESQNQNWRVSKSNEETGCNQQADMGASSEPTENTTEPLSVLPDPKDDRRHSS